MSRDRIERLALRIEVLFGFCSRAHSFDVTKGELAG